jgi:hypothetical protein
MRDRIQGLFSVHRSQEDALFDHLTKFVSPTTKFIVHIEVLIQEDICRVLSVFCGCTEKLWISN